MLTVFLPESAVDSAFARARLRAPPRHCLGYHSMATFLHKSTDVHSPSSRNDSTSPYLPGSRASALGIWTPLRRVQPSQPSLRRANTVTQSGIAKRPDRLLATRRKKDQSPTLGHTKSSTEALHQRAMTHDGIAGPREGNNFTVANVGNNGKLYLR